MAYEGTAVLDWSFEAAADLSAKQYYFVKISSAGKVDVCSAVTDVPIGVLQNKPASGQMASVRIIGITKISSDEALTAGNAIGTSADGQAQIVVVGTETTVYLAGRALSTTGGANEIGTALINCAAAARAA